MRTFIIAAAVFATACVFTSQANAQINFGVSVGDRNGFYFDIGSYYRVPEREVVIVRDRNIRDEELPVVFYFADMAHVRPSVIVDLREDGYTWMDIALRFRLSPSMFYDPVYGRPYGYDQWRPGRGWGRIRFADDDFIRFCNVRFLSERYHYRPEVIMRMREHQHDFYMIHNDIRREMDHHESRDVRQYRNDRHDQDRNVEMRHDNGRRGNGNEAPNGNDARKGNDSRDGNRHRPGRERE